MRHGVKKIKFTSGIDANRMLMRKLAVNFLSKGYLQTTLIKAKALKTHLEKLVSKMKVKNESNKNYLLRYLAETKIVNDCFDRVGPALEKIRGGYVRIIKVGMRSADGSSMAKVEWAYPVLKEEKKTQVKQTASVKTTAAKEK
ncbi:50S ribosomal protein L17 [Candidatus Roizmanbacteria bacterium]|nr:50S ribosomal protein L17 [Candidatus Roizmanbacteria bacterium]